MVDISLVDSAIVGLSSVNQVYLTSGRAPQRLGNSYESSAPGGGYHSKNGYFIMNGSAPKFWSILCNAMGKPELIDDPRFATNSLRVAHKAELDAIIETWTTTMETDEVINLLLSHGFAAAPVLTIDQVVADPHIGGVRNMFVEVDHPQVGKIKVTNQAIKMTETNPEIRCPAPLLGQHNEEVYVQELGFTSDQLVEFRKEGIV